MPTHDIELGPTPASVPRGRNYVRERCLAAGVPGKAADACLLASEVLTNALKHAGTPMTMTVTSPERDAIRVAVHDGTAEQPIRRANRRGVSRNGRGILLLDLIATRWGVTQERTGKTVWFEV
jgi:hypothetical protein